MPRNGSRLVWHSPVGVYGPSPFLDILFSGKERVASLLEFPGKDGVEMRLQCRMSGITDEVSQLMRVSDIVEEQPWTCQISDECVTAGANSTVLPHPSAPLPLPKWRDARDERGVVRRSFAADEGTLKLRPSTVLEWARPQRPRRVGIRSSNVIIVSSSR